MPTVARGAETTPSASSIVCSGASGWATTETGTGWAGFGAAVPDGGGGRRAGLLLLAARRGLLDLLLHVAQDVGGLLEHAAAGRVGADQADLLAQVVLVLRQVLGEVGQPG